MRNLSLILSEADGMKEEEQGRVSNLNDNGTLKADEEEGWKT